MRCVKNNSKYEIQDEALFKKDLGKDEQGRKYKFITNNWEVTNEEVVMKADKFLI